MVEGGTHSPPGRLERLFGGRRRRRVLGLLAATGVVLGGALGVKVADYERSARAAAGRSWHGKVVRVARSGAEGSPGLQARSRSGALAPLAEGAEVSAGIHVVTDPRTRARVAFDDGTELALDRDTELDIEDAPRTLRVTHGALLADIAHLEGAPSAHLITPNGDVSVIGTKLLLTAESDHTSVEVLRGEVELADASGSPASISAGQEGIAWKSGKVDITPVNDLAQRIAFGELGRAAPVHNEDTDRSVSGLGELRARRPAKSDEKDHALHLARHTAAVRIVGTVARTEVDETFANDTGDDLEGVYRFPLPPGAQIERLALEVDGKLQEGAFVDKSKAAAIFRGAIRNATPRAPKPEEEVFWVPGPWRDPALLEWQRGGRFELKIFPIPKHGSRRIVLAYTETVPPVGGLRRYVYPLPQATASEMRIDDFGVDLKVLGADPKVGVRATGYELSQADGGGEGVHLAVAASAFTPSGDLAVEYALASDRTSPLTAWTFADPSTPSEDAYVAIALRPKLPHWTDARPRDQVIVLDVGRAMFGERLARARRLVEQVAEEMDRRDRLTVLACDVACTALPGGWKAPGAAAAHDVDAFLAKVTADGASDLVGAVRAAGAVPGRDATRDIAVVLVSDGAASAGYRRSAHVVTEVARALPDPHSHFVAVPVGTDADVDTLADLARGAGGVVVPYAPGEPLETAAIDVLNATYGTTLRDVELTLPEGLRDAAPGALSPMRAGGETLVTARLAGAHAEGEIVLRGKVAGDPFEARYPLSLAVSSDPGNAFVPRLYAAARIADRERDAGDAARAELVGLSQRFAVPCRFTSLLVLESEAMFDAFGIRREARGPVWTGDTEAVATEVEGAKGEEERADKDGSGNDLRESPYAAPPADFSGPLGGSRTGAGGGGEGFGRAAGHAALPPRAKEISPRDDAALSPPASTPAPAPSTAQGDVLVPSPRRIAPPWRPGRWMKRVWFREADVSASATPPIGTDRLASARAARLAAPDARRSTKDLVRVLALNGLMDELGATVAEWTARDPLDADAIAARADLLARQGDREASLRVMGGLVANPSSTPKDASKLEATLAQAYERAGKSEACAFRVAAADLAPDDVEAVARAAACEHDAGREQAAEAWIAGLAKDTARAAAAARLAKLESPDAMRENAASGDVTVEATWDASAGADLDLAIIDPAGNRAAWSGRLRVRASDPTSRSHEQIALPSAAAGPFVVEIDRADGATTPVRGTLVVRALGEVLRRDFVLTGARTQIGRVLVRWDSRLVPIEGTGVPACNPPFEFDANGHKHIKPECL